MTAPDRTAGALAGTRLSWLLDAPLFIDEPFIERLFDAVVRPEYEVQGRIVGHVSEETRRSLTGVEVGGQGGLKLPFLGSFEASSKGKHDRERGSAETRSEQLSERAVRTAGRQLEEIAAVYVDQHPEKIIFLDTSGSVTDFLGTALTLSDLRQPDEALPRRLVFLDVLPPATFLPMASELQNGTTTLLFQQFIARLWHEGEQRPGYIQDGAPDEERRQYWSLLQERFDSRIAMEVVEQVGAAADAGSGRISWIDFRLPTGDGGDAVHLHIAPDGRYSTGTFAYNLVRRSHHHGARMIGTLKAGFDLNILAIFDR
ncbi:MAG TPA: hypothetical protein VGD10_05300 [Allosphingosinicella sp.]|uniref:hypothetical protein n=1 Tax=Allosphingosinicella sp. TaxID=2823234 RepID=UPI002ED95EBE